MADIAINPVDRRVQFTGNTGTGPFAFTFNILADEDIAVYKNTTLLTLTTHYSVTTNANGTGSITLVSGQALVSSDVLTIIGGRDLSRTTDFVTAGDLLASSLNEQLDSLVIMTQQLDEKVGRTIKTNPGDVYTDLELPTKDNRKGTVLGFNATSGDPEVGPTIADVSSLASITADIATLADIEDGTDATDAIQTVAGISSNVTTVAGISSNVTTVAGNTSNINAVAADASDIGTVAGSISNVNTVADNDSNITSVAGNATNINTVAGINTNVTTVAGKAADITTVAGISSDVTTVASDGTDIGTVATDISNVNTVATNISDVNTVAGNISALNEKVSKAGDTMTGDLTIQGDLTVSGTTTTINTETINLADNQIVLNSNFTGSNPTENCGIEIERGTQTNATLIWDESNDRWTVSSNNFVANQFIGDGSNLTNVTASSVYVTESSDDNNFYNILFADTTGTGNVQMSPQTDKDSIFKYLAFNPSTNTFMTNDIRMYGSINFEGSSVDANETTLDVTDPTADRTILLPDASGTIALNDVATTSTNGLMSSSDKTKLDGVAASANNYTHPNHTGEVTSTADGATVVADNVIDEANLKVSNSPTNGYFLQAQSGNTGGLTWAPAAAAYGNSDVDTHLNQSSAGNNQILSWSGSDYAWVDDTDTTYSNATTSAAGLMSSTDKTKLDGIEANADVTDATNVTAAGALMDSEVTNLAQVKAFDSSDYATAAQGTTADNALPKAGGTMTGNITFASTQTFDSSKLSGALPAIDGSNLTSVAASTVLVSESADDDVNYNVLFSDTGGSGNVQMSPTQDDGGLVFNPSDNALYSVNYLVGSKITHDGDADTFLLFSNDKIIIDAGGSEFINCTQGASNFVKISQPLQLALNTNLSFEGSTDNDFETTLTVTDPTADRTITLPNASGTVALNDVATTSANGLMSSSDKTKLDGIETGADVTDAANVTAAGALMDSEVTNLSQVKSFDSSDYATAAQGTKADAALPKAGGTMTGAITFASGQQFDGRDVSADGSKLDGIESGAEVNDPAFKTISVSGQSDVVADADADTLTFAAGSNVTITTNASTDTVTIAATDTNTTYSAGSGLDLSGTTFSHSDTSSQASVNNSGNTVIQDITLDTYGHITGITSTTISATSANDATITLSAGTNLSGGGNFTTNQSTNETITFNLDASPSVTDLYVADQIIHTGDTNTYTQFHANDQWRVVTAGTERLEVNSSTIISAEPIQAPYFEATSDINLKENIVQVEDAISKVQKLSGYTYNFIDEPEIAKAGLIAQEVQEVLPEAVRLDDSDNLRLDYNGTIALLVEAIKDQQEQISELKAQVGK